MGLLDITGLGSVADLAKTIVNKFIPDSVPESDKIMAQLKLQEMLQAREDNITNAQRDVILGELNQSDNFTKRARPTIVYSGLLFILIVNVLFPIVTFFTGRGMPKLELPSEFWVTWGSICGIYAIGRSVEKRGTDNKVVSSVVKLITGGK